MMATAFRAKGDNQAIARSQSRGLVGARLHLRLRRGFRGDCRLSGVALAKTEEPSSVQSRSPAVAGLDDLDKELETRGDRFARYVDDFVVLEKSKVVSAAELHSRGWVMHRRLLTTTDGLGSACWTRTEAHCASTPVAEKEIYGWIESLRRAEQSKGQAKLVTVCDREADFYDFLQVADCMNTSFPVRAKVNRSIIPLALAIDPNSLE